MGCRPKVNQAGLGVLRETQPAELFKTNNGGEPVPAVVASFHLL